MSSPARLAPPQSCRLVRSPRAASRVQIGLEWMLAHRSDEEVLVVASTSTAASELLRRAGTARGASFGWAGITLARLASELAAAHLGAAGLAPVGGLGLEALTARVLQLLEAEGRLGRFAQAARGPGLARAVARALREVRLQNIEPRQLELASPELRLIADAFERELRRARLADRALIFATAARSAADRSRRHRWLDIPILFLDVPAKTALESDLLRELAARAPECLATVPSGDELTWKRLCSALPSEGSDLNLEEEGEDSLRSVQVHLFGSTPARRELDSQVTFFSAPGESRECVEIARRILRWAGQGVPFDRMAVALRSPEEYRAHLEEALGRAGVPGHFAPGTRRPHPSGRAFVALLGCAAEKLSARRFAEYLSLGEVPDATSDGAPPPPSPPGERWVFPDEELLAPEAAAFWNQVRQRADALEIPDEPGGRAVVAGSLRAPWRWERLIVDAAVIGGLERWKRRLDGLERELHWQLQSLEDPEDAAALRIEAARRDLHALRAYALPLLEELARLPETASWGVWLDALSGLASRALRHPESIFSVLSELAPMRDVGPVGLAEVLAVLSDRLLEIALPPAGSRYGKVFIAPIEALRGLSFEVVFVPGLAERLLPRKIAEDPILLDDARRRIGDSLVTNEQRVGEERLALRMAVGAAAVQLVLSYPRLDLEQARPRVPSFYALEAVRAVTGRLPGFTELARAAECVGEARIGWPAPRRSEEAIDEAEHDLALLESLLHADPEESVGMAHYLLTANAHLGRALRFRARRWLRRWTSADGLVDPGSDGLDAMRAHALSARSYSPTALEKYAACPYQFFLYAIHKLAPRQWPEAIEEMDPLQRGSLVHEVQRELFGRLEGERLLPVTAGNISRARELLDEVLERVAERFRDDLAPAIDRVWQDGVDSIRADLREWLRRMSEDDSGWVPWRFELAFGLSDRRARDARSVLEPVPLDCGIVLRGSIDLVERRADGSLRATDHKTGKVRVRREAVVAGGAALQALFYALALEKLFPGCTIDSGRLHYCTASGGFEERVVHLNPGTRRSAARVGEVLASALDAPFLPAAPAPGACERCDYRAVCGPYEEMRSSRKPPSRLERLSYLRKLP